jgi:transcriptional regulator of acetoin/glycerol metabolism
MLEDTSTDASGRHDDAVRQEYGLWWVAPQERFDPFRMRLSIGRSDSNGICLESTKVSRVHALVERDGPLWLLRDNGSKNGTWVNGQRHDVVALNPQDSVRIGDWVALVCSAPPTTEGSVELFSSPAPNLLLSSPTRIALGPLEKLAKRDISVAIYGETGTGKEQIAAAIHQHSQRPGPLIAVNCATISESMAEALLFGHTKGAFTGAHHAARGFIRAADRGTLFLDEISDLPAAVQSKLLRALEDRRVTPLGGTGRELVDFRLVVACQEPLSNLVSSNLFRADLYARLRGVEITLPPLRERRQEVIRLLQHFIAREFTRIPVLDHRLLEALCRYDWPQNIREVKQLSALLGVSGKQLLTLSDLPARFQSAVSASENEAPAASGSTRRAAWLHRHARELERLEQALNTHTGNLSRAAREAQIPRHRARRLLAAEAELLNDEKR